MLGFVHFATTFLCKLITVLLHVETSHGLLLDDLSVTTLKTLVEMTSFENLVPRYSALAPIFWSEIQQQQQQRRHPQHLLQNSQGDASCHTRTWRLQKKGLEFNT